MLPTKEDIEQCIKLMGLLPGSQTEVPKPLEIAGRLKELLPLYDEGLGGMAIVEVDIHIRAPSEGGPLTGSSKDWQIHTYTVGGEYELLPQDEVDDLPTVWNIKDIRAHRVKRE